MKENGLRRSKWLVGLIAALPVLLIVLLWTHSNNKEYVPSTLIVGVVTNHEGRVSVQMAVQLRLEGGQELITFTDYKGSFVFYNAPPGAHEIIVLAVKGVKARKLKLTGGEIIKNVHITLPERT